MIKVCPTCDQKYPEDEEFCGKDGTRLEELKDETVDPLLGKALDGRWVIQERIGEGGMGSVYLASQRSVDRQVAIKTLRPELCNSREFVDRFFREARVASTISHPHCVTILDFGQTDDGTLYLAMEYLEGMPLADRLRHPDLSVREILQICMQISSALAAAHQQNIIHRDLKPDNVFLLSISDGSTFIKVLDFGIAKVLDAEKDMTKTGQVFGTPEYMSPEQCRGDKLDGRSDLYSLGCILYRMLSGHPPFESDTPMAVLVSHASENPPHINEVIQRGDIPDQLTDLCMRLLAKQPDDRPADAQAVRAELEAMMGHTTSGSTPAVRGPASQDESAPEGTGPTMAADSGEVSAQSGPLAADGGTAGGGSARQQVEQQADPPSAQRAQASSGHTAAQDAFAEEKKSSLPLILGVGVAVLLAAGCTIGAIYASYTHFVGDDGNAIAALFGDDEADQNDENADEPSDDEEPAVADGDDQADEADEADDGEAKLAKNEPSDDKNEGPGDDGSRDDDSEDDKPGGDSDGAKPADSDDDGKGGSGSDDSSKRADADDKKNDDKKDDGSKTTKVEVNADKAEVAVNSKEGDSEKTNKKADKDDSNKSDAKATTDTKEKDPPKKLGSIRQTGLSASGSACIKPNVEKVERSARSRFSSCYSDALGADPDLGGKVMMAFNISTDGSVITPEMLVSEVSPVDSCFLGALSNLRFDPPSGGRCYVRLTYQLTP